MPAFALALVGLLVLPVSATAPLHADAAQIASTTQVAAITKTSLIAPNIAYADMKAGSTPFTVKLTGYNAVPSQTDGNPFVTASGAFSNPEVVVARSSDLASSLPFGTVVKITRSYQDTPSCNYSKVASQIGYRVVADSMNPRIHNTMDVLLDQSNTVSVGGRTVNPGIALGLCGNVSVSVVGHIAVKDIPATQAELAQMFENPTLADARF